MVVRNKLHRVIDSYRNLLNSKLENSHRHGSIKNGNKTKNKILDFYLKNNRWPSRLSTKKPERVLASSFENFLSKENRSYDSNLRRIVMTTGRKSNNKRKHNVQGFKKEILAFIKENGRVPAVHAEGESQLRSRLDYYTKNCNDMTLLGEVYSVDKCHKSGIPSKFRSVINEALNTDKPLIRLVK